MKLQISERDKKLLFFLAIFLILVGFGLLLILPQWEKHMDLEDELMEYQNQKLEMQMSIESLESVETSLEIVKKEYEEVGEQFYPILESHEAERMITRIFLEHGMSVQDLEISATPQDLQLQPYEWSVLAQESQRMEESAGESTQENTEAVNVPSYVWVEYVTVRATGRADRMQELVDDLFQNYKGLQVTSYSMNSQSGLTESQEVVNVGSLAMNLTIYSVIKD